MLTMTALTAAHLHRMLAKRKPAPAEDGFVTLLLFLGPLCRVVKVPYLVVFNVCPAAPGSTAVYSQQHSHDHEGWIQLYAISLAVSLSMAYLLEWQTRAKFKLQVLA